MILREAITFLIITVLIFAGSGSLFSGAVARAQRDCHQANAQLLHEGREGPLQACTVL